MIQQNRQTGINAALAHFGVKEAGFADTVKTLLVGQPREYAKQLQSGQLFKRDGLIAGSLNPVNKDPSLHPALRGGLTALNAAMMYGLPAYQLTQAARSDPSHRGSTVGATAGSLVGGALGGPLGLVGSLGGSVLGGALGESLGRSFNRPPDPRRRRDPR